MRSTNRFARIVAVAGFVFLPKVGFAADETITALGDFTFLNADVTIDARDTVTWIDLQLLHNVSESNSSGSNTYNGTGFRSGDVGDVDTYQFTCNTPGVFYYICEPHASIGMKGIVTVLSPLDPNDVYVDFGAGTNGNGAQSLPFDNLQDAVTAANASAVIHLEPGRSAESFTGAGAISKALTIRNNTPGGGSVFYWPCRQEEFRVHLKARRIQNVPRIIVMSAIQTSGPEAVYYAEIHPAVGRACRNAERSS